MKKTQVARLSEDVTGMVNEQTSAEKEYLIAENRILRSHSPAQLRSTAPGRPTVPREITDLIVRMARENSCSGYDRIAGALKNLGHDISDQTVGNVLRRFGIDSRAQALSADEPGAVHSHSHGRLGWSTSSPSRCSRGAGWQLLTFCSSCT